jgi:perosamine synthetase
MTESSHFIPVAKPCLDEREAQAARRAILSGWVTQGPEVAAFEREFAAYVGAPFSCAVSSCTTALHLALLGIGVQPGDEVITVSHSFIATANSIRYCGAVPVFIDIQPSTFNIDPSQIEGAITDRTRCILCVHQMGMPCDLQAILDIAGRHSLPLVEDAACAIGSETLWEGKWERIGKPHGRVACFSFHPRKVITTGDGGMITTADPELNEKLRLLRQHGMSVPDSVRHESTRVVCETYELLGYNYRMTDIQAAIGREQLKRMPEILQRRRFLAARYNTLLANVPGIRLPEEPLWARSNWQSFSVRLPEGCNQRRVMQFMLDKGVATRRGIMCAHREPAYKEIASHMSSAIISKGLKESELAQDQCILLPLYPQMTIHDQTCVVETLSKACENCRK